MVKRDLFRIIGLFVLFVLAIVALRVWVFEPVTINEQMANQYLAEKDVIIADRNKEIQYGNFVLYTVDKKEYVGRVIAMEGDSVTYLYDVLYRNNEIVPEIYLEIKGQGILHRGYDHCDPDRGCPYGCTKGFISDFKRQTDRHQG